MYTGGGEARTFQVGQREAHNVLSAGHALFDIEIEGDKAVPVVVKEQQLHPVKGDLQHLDLQQVSLDTEIETEVPLELEGADVAPGLKAGGVLEHVTRQVLVSALPTEIPDVITGDVSEMEINDTLTLTSVTAPDGCTFVAEDLDEITLAIISPPRVEVEPTAEVEEETEVIGEEGEESEEESSGEEDSDNE